MIAMGEMSVMLKQYLVMANPPKIITFPPQGV